MNRSAIALASGLLLLMPVPVHARMICTIVADIASGRVLVQDGDCSRAVTPASTFKIALAAIGYDSGFLVDRNSPVLPYRPGDPDWGGDAWTRPVDPEHWMRHSVVWYSQRITHHLGRAGLARYMDALEYGNRDVSGDAGKDNALERAWISSSLRISPEGQIDFLRRLLTLQLPISQRAVEATVAIVEQAKLVDGWAIAGKTGSAYPRRADGSFDRARGWGWYVGWAVKGDRRVVFARLDQDERRHAQSGGLRARDALLAAWPAIARGR